MADNPMLKFVTVPRDMPTKREAQARTGDFDEIYAEYARPRRRRSSPGAAASAACRTARAIARCTTTSPTGCG